MLVGNKKIVEGTNLTSKEKNYQKEIIIEVNKDYYGTAKKRIFK